jgi:hypothetical protein
VAGDLLGAALGGHMLGASQRGSPTLAGQAQQITGDQRNGATRALLPWCVGGRVDYDLANGAPTCVVGVAAGDEEPSESLGHADGPWFGPMGVEVAQCGTHVAAAVHCPGQLSRSTPRLSCLNVDASTALAGVKHRTFTPNGASLKTALTVEFLRAR